MPRESHEESGHLLLTYVPGLIIRVQGLKYEERRIHRSVGRLSRTKTLGYLEIPYALMQSCYGLLMSVSIST